MSTALPETKAGSRRWVLLIPLAIFLGLAGLFLLRLGAGDASRIPSALIGRPVPQTDLPPVAGLIARRRGGSWPRCRRASRAR